MRWQIEQCYQQTITPETIRDYDRGKGVRRLKLFESLYQPESDSSDKDTAELLAGIPLGDLTHATARRRLAMAALRPFTDPDSLQLSSDLILRQSEIEAFMHTFRHDHEQDVRLFYGWRQDYSRRPINLLRFLLHQCGLKLTRYGKRESDQRYRLDPEALATMERYVQQRQYQNPEKDSLLLTGTGA
ncbi:MAG: hypothetical protein K8L99_15220 [Anaerolineae bacterium]|nr:hypothetical protein [Anaerolineae bacterium]